MRRVITEDPIGGVCRIMNLVNMVKAMTTFFGVLFEAFSVQILGKKEE